MNAKAVTSSLGICLTFWASAEARAQGKDIYDLSLDELSKLVITDTKIGQAQEAVTQKFELVYPREFDRQTYGHGNIAELLRYTSGQFVNPLSRNDPNWGSFGGLGPKYNGYLLDGLPIDSFADAMSLDPWAFERVEVQKGPASVMYSNYLSMDFAGNEAPLAGTTNFVLKDWIEGPATRLMVAGGSYRTANARVYHQDRRGNVLYFFGTSLERSNYTNYGTSDSWLHIIDAPEYLKFKTYAKATYLFDRNDHKLSLFAHHAEHTGDVGRPNRDFAHRYETINASYSNQISDRLNLQAKIGLRAYHRRWAEDNYPSDLDQREHDGVRQRIVPADLTLNVAHLDGSLLTLGSDSQFATYRSYVEMAGTSTPSTDVSANSLGIFAQEKLVTGQWIFRVGGRFNRTQHTYALFAGSAPAKRENSWNTPLWSAGIRYNPSQRLAFYGNAGSSFVAPSAKQLGGSLAASSVGVAGANGQLPNLELIPEKGISSDLGFELHPIDAMTLGVRAAYSLLNKAIVENVVSRSPSQSQSTNVGNVRAFTMELGIEHRVRAYLLWFANVTYMETNVKNPLDSDQQGADVPFVPNFLVNQGLCAQLPLGIQLSPYLHVVGHYYDSTSKSNRQRFGPYPLLNVRLQKTLMANDSFMARASIDLNNLLDRRFEMPWQFRDPGFNALGILELSL